MTWKECKQLISEDYSRLNKRRFGILGCLITNHSFKITFWFRICSFINEKGRRVFRFLLLPIWLLYKHNQYKTGIQLTLGTKIGGGAYFAHFGTIVVNSESVIGRNCTIFQGVTIGSVRGKGVPKIGDNVVLFSGVKIIGNVTLGDNVIVGANAVVTRDVPNGAVVAGVPAKQISMNGEKIAQLYISSRNN